MAGASRCGRLSHKRGRSGFPFRRRRLCQVQQARKWTRCKIPGDRGIVFGCRECPKLERTPMSNKRYFESPVRTLREACREIGRDAAGRRCLECPVSDLCEEAKRAAERC